MTNINGFGEPTSQKPSSGSQYAIRYWRDKVWAELWRQAGHFKPEGWVTSPYKYEDRQQALDHIALINQQKPTHPCELAVFWRGEER